MSVLIKGMEMPNSCSNCELCACYAESKGEVYRCDITMTPVKHFEKRLHDCPLVELPPHGRLIDEHWIKDAMITTLEALKKNPKMDKQEMHLIAAFDTLRVMLEDAPTIIGEET